MDQQRCNDWLDDLTRQWADAGSRRALLGALLGSVAGLGWSGSKEDSAALARPKRRRRRRCKGGKKRCGRRCVSVKGDRRNCGRCKRRCPAGERCRGGQCQPEAPPDPCQLTLAAAGCAFAEAESRWQCPAKTSLAGADLSGCNLEGAGLAKTDLSGASLDSANLSFSILAAANLSDATLLSANLGKADLTGATLTDAEVRAAFLQAANLADANLTGAIVHESNLTDVAWGNTTCPDGRNSDTESPATCCGHLLDSKAGAGCPSG